MIHLPGALAGVMPRVRAGELADRAQFRLRSSARASLAERLRSCKEPGDYFDFALDAFPGGPSQNRAELLGLVGLAAQRCPDVVVELGTEAGGTTFVLSQAMPTVSTAVGVDLFVHNRHRLEAFKRPDQILHLIDGPSGDPATLAKVQALLGGASIDLLLIDADHAFAGVWWDFVAYQPLVRDGGLIVFHDIVPDSRLRGLPATGSYVGEVPIVWRLLKPHFRHWELVDSWDQDGRGIGVLELDASVPVSFDLLNPPTIEPRTHCFRNDVSSK